MPEFSIVTIVKGRRKQLANLLQSVQASTLLPYDVQVVCMDNADEIMPPSGLNVSIHVIDDSHKLPLAAARNAGIKATKTGNIIFIDVDCIVSPTLFENMLAQLQPQNIITAYPLYLPFVPETGNYAALKHEAVSHPAREHLPVGEPVEHLQFWSLIFGIQKQTFENIGGFDESFLGYGAEDTDFAMMFNQQGIKLFFVQNYVLHQYHDKHDPPLNYFDSIIENAMRYRQKWNILPMQRWLKAFQKMGLIKMDQADNITIVQKPTDEQLRGSISQNPY
ncbi:glycosyltransferase family 2 protein [Mucilaginibacter aquatilis]|uniref:Glycosyltransferase n=1 Tax=Mucilaginibacter aquatilis TaxID=1517760 RepID=A0A6I4ICX2_9SPHI|nr:glycosyltransferase family A protein [Mucilaginibacter aquatilis]MVN93012.1 glycosyltransferase [Mucilaginibacter aquatilis]